MIRPIFLTSGPPEVLELVRENEALAVAEGVLFERSRVIRAKIDEIHLRARPEYPTARHREGIAEALERCRTAAPARSHHGDPCAPGEGQERYDVVAVGSEGFISIRHRAPTSQATGGSLWSFTDDELETIRDGIEGNGDFEITKAWRHGDGVSIKVRPASQLARYRGAWS